MIERERERERERELGQGNTSKEPVYSKAPPSEFILPEFRGQ